MNALRCFAPLLIVSAISVSSLQANMISGSVIGVFEPNGLDYTSIINSPDGDASFRTGVVAGKSFQSGVVFDSQAFTDLTEGETVSVGTFNYYNGVTQIGTSSHTAALDLYLKLNDPLSEWVHLSTLNFGIDATINTPEKLVADKFTVNYLQPVDIRVGDQWFSVSLSGLASSTTVAENTWLNAGSLRIQYSPAVAVGDGGGSVLLLGLGLLAVFAYANLRFFKTCSWAV